MIDQKKYFIRANKNSSFQPSKNNIKSKNKWLVMTLHQKSCHLFLWLTKRTHPPELYDANDNGEGVVVAKSEALTKKDINTWRTLPGIKVA